MTDYIAPWGLESQGSDVVGSVQTTSAPFDLRDAYFTLYSLGSLGSLGTTGETEDYFTRRVRFACHMLLDRIPAQGLPELVDSLRGIYDFYSEPAAPSVPLLASPTEPVKVKIGRTYERPEFDLELE